MLAQALTQLEAGQVSAEEALKAALAGRAAMTRLLARAAGRHRRRPTLRRWRNLPDAVINASVRSVRRRLGRLKGVTSVHWGVKEMRGRGTSDCAVVVHVERKLSPAALRSRGMKAAPRHVTVRRGGRRFAVPVDVQAVKGPARLHAGFVRPGDHGAIRRNGIQIGALGAVAAGPAGTFAITAGHVAGLLGPGAVADCLDDEAGAFPIGGVRLNRFGQGSTSRHRAGGSRPEGGRTRSDVRAQSHQRRHAPPRLADVARHLHAGRVAHRQRECDAWVPDAGRGHHDERPHYGPPRHRGGDSGAPALDDSGAVLGFVIGGDASHTPASCQEASMRSTLCCRFALALLGLPSIAAADEYQFKLQPKNGEWGCTGALVRTAELPVAVAIALPRKASRRPASSSRHASELEQGDPLIGPLTRAADLAAKACGGSSTSKRASQGRDVTGTVDARKVDCGPLAAVASRHRPRSTVSMDRIDFQASRWLDANDWRLDLIRSHIARQNRSGRWTGSCSFRTCRRAQRRRPSDVDIRARPRPGRHGDAGDRDRLVGSVDWTLTRCESIPNYRVYGDIAGLAAAQAAAPVGSSSRSSGRPHHVLRSRRDGAR